MSARPSLSSTSSLSSADFNKYTITGKNITMSNRQPKGFRSMKHSHSQPELPSIAEIVNVQTKQSLTFGITEYTVPRGANLFPSRSSTIHAKCADGLIDKYKKLHAYKPSPGAYNIEKKWNKTILGTMKGGKRNTFIQKIFLDGKQRPKPGPGDYSPSTKMTQKRNSLGVINKGSRIPFTSDSEFLGTVSPSATYTEKIVLPKPFTYNVQKKGWRIAKIDGPDPQSYPLKEQALANYTKKVSPRWKQGKGKRKFFTDNAIKAGKQSPGAGMYEAIDYNKIHRRLSSKRH